MRGESAAPSRSIVISFNTAGLRSSVYRADSPTLLGPCTTHHPEVCMFGTNLTYHAHPPDLLPEPATSCTQQREYLLGQASTRAGPSAPFPRQTPSPDLCHRAPVPSSSHLIKFNIFSPFLSATYTAAPSPAPCPHAKFQL